MKITIDTIKKWERDYTIYDYSYLLDILKFKVKGIEGKFDIVVLVVETGENKCKVKIRDTETLEERTFMGVSNDVFNYTLYTLGLKEKSGKRGLSGFDRLLEEII